MNDITSNFIKYMVEQQLGVSVMIHPRDEELILNIIKEALKRCPEADRYYSAVQFDRQAELYFLMGLTQGLILSGFIVEVIMEGNQAGGNQWQTN